MSAVLILACMLWVTIAHLGAVFSCCLLAWVKLLFRRLARSGKFRGCWTTGLSLCTEVTWFVRTKGSVEDAKNTAVSLSFLVALPWMFAENEGMADVTSSGSAGRAAQNRQ